MKRRLMALLLLLVWVATVLPVAAAADKATFKVKSPDELPKSGESFEVVVEIADNSGFSVLQYGLVFDKTEMECVKMRTGKVLQGIISVTNPVANPGPILVSASTNLIEGDGVLVVYSFEAKKDIEKFEFDFVDVTFADIELNPLDFEVSGATYIYEDISNPEEEEIEDTSPRDEYLEHEDDEQPANDTNKETEDEEKTKPSQDSNIGVEKPSVSDKTDGDDEKVVLPSETEPSEEDGVTIQLFADVQEHWAKEYIAQAAELGLFKGDSNGNFNPDANVTRAQFITVLWRMAGAPQVNESTPFLDTDDQIDEFKSAIAWGYANGYISGISETEFDPNGTLTREAGMKILHYYSGAKVGGEGYFYAIYDGIFEDSSSVSQWAKSSIYWGVYNKLISGMTSTTLEPQGTATRAQLAKILVNYVAYFQAN